ncbi:MAG: class I SAM-dependent methyltransferase [Pseudohongiellaceae bacterium]
MNDWTCGYVAEIGYTFGYYTELNPLRVKLAFLNSGLALPENGSACELGFGQGMSANLHAAATATQWCGTDFNPSQATFAQELARVSGSGARMYDEAFDQFCNRSDLPDFDYIGVHGIWSWISDENRAVIVDFIRRKLKVGGVLYISYNTQPGWAAMVPMRDLLTEHGEVMGSAGGGIVSRIDDALTFADKMLATNPAYVRANPQVPGRLQKIKEQNRNYLAHEYFNRDWLPMSFSRMAAWLSPAKLSYACSAHFLDHVDALNLNAEQQQLLKEITDPMFRETVRDFCVNQQFRRDYWVRGPRKLNSLQQTEALREQRLLLVQTRADVSLKVNIGLGEAKLHESIYNPILDAFADNRPKSIAQIEKAVAGKIVFAQVVQAVMVLAGSGALMPVQDESRTAKAKANTDKLNLHLFDKARGSGDISHLASPVTGGGILVGRLQQLFLLANSQGNTTPEAWADFVWQILVGQGQKLVKEGKTINSPEENIAELTTLAQNFAEKQLPILKALLIA